MEVAIFWAMILLAVVLILVITNINDSKHPESTTKDTVVFMLSSFFVLSSITFVWALVFAEPIKYLPR
jgi:hypothetical protein